MKKIALGFGYDVVPRGSGAGTVYFDDIGLCSTRCALGKRPCGLALTDYAPGGAPSGDCLIDHKEIQIMATTWLARDSFVKTKNPDDVNLVLYYPMDEGDGNKIYPHASGRLNDPCLWSGTFWNSGLVPPRNTAEWSTDHAPGIGGSHCLYFDGKEGCRVQCGRYGQAALGIGPDGVNAITMSAWIKTLGQRIWDPYLKMKGLGILGKRGGWSKSTVIWFFGLTEDADQSFVSARTINLYSAVVINAFIGQWIHVAATYPNPSGNPADANSYARIYLNGAQIGSGRFYFDNGDDNEIFLSIGNTMDQNSWPSSPEGFWGYIDEVRIYDRPLEPNEIAYLADPTPPDGNLMIPIPSAAEIYEEEPEGSRVVNFKDFALVANNWLVGFEWP
jgi:hypothetical protein